MQIHELRSTIAAIFLAFFDFLKFVMTCLNRPLCPDSGKCIGQRGPKEGPQGIRDILLSASLILLLIVKNGKNRVLP